MRNEIYIQLKETDGFVSGEALSAKLGVTRAALWKHIKAMKADGAEIESIQGKGYQMIKPPDVPRAEYISAHIDPDIKIFFEKSVTSTNDLAKQAAHDTMLDRAVFIAEEQTAGRGRKGRVWQSPAGEGLYMTFLARPKIDPKRLSGITLMAAVALCWAIENLTGLTLGIKWPNDIIIDGKKTAGILTESMLSMDGVEFIICGIGINVHQRQFDDDISHKACSLVMSAGHINKTLLAASVIDAFFDAYNAFLKHGLDAFIPAFREKNVLRGEVTVISPNRRDIGTLLGFDDSGAILIDTDEGIKRFVAGEVSIRGENGYV